MGIIKSLSDTKTYIYFTLVCNKRLNVFKRQKRNKILFIMFHSIAAQMDTTEYHFAWKQLAKTTKTKIVNVKETYNQNSTKANATKDNAHKIHTNKYIKHYTSKLMTTSMREKTTDKYKNAYIQAITIEYLRRKKRKLSPCTMFDRLRQKLVVIQSILCAASWFEVFRYIDVTNKC